MNRVYLSGGQSQLGKGPDLKHGAADFHRQEHKQYVVQTEQSHQEEGGFDQPSERTIKYVLR